MWIKISQLAFGFFAMVVLLGCQGPVQPVPSQPSWSFFPTPSGVFETRVPVQASAGGSKPVYISVGLDPRKEGALHRPPLWLNGSGSWSLNWSTPINDGWDSVRSTTYLVEPQRPQIAAGADHSLVVKSGVLWAWGHGANGQLAQGSTKPNHQTQRLTVVHAEAFLAAWAQGDNTAFLDENGDLWVCGYGVWPQGSEGFLVSSGNPTRVPLPSGIRVTTAALAWSGDVWAVDTTGGLWVWGLNQSESLGTGTKAEVRVPVKVMDSVVMVSAGTYHALALQSDGTLRVTGRHHGAPGDFLDEYNRLGTGTSTSNETGWVSLGVWKDIFAMGAEDAHSWFLTKTGDLWVWGSNAFGQLPGVDAGVTRVDIPTKVRTSLAAVAAGNRCTLVVPEVGVLESFGEAPKSTATLTSAGLRAIQVGGFHVLALTEGFHDRSDNPWASLVFWGEHSF